MPLPKPRTNESESVFIDRCISDAEVQSEFPEMNQRIAVCNSLYRPTKKALNYDFDRFIFGFNRKRDIQERNWTRKFSRFYYAQYQKGIKQFLETNHINENGLFRFTDFEDLMVSMFMGMGWEFASWYMRNFNRYQTKAISTNPNELRGVWEQQILQYAKIYSASKISLIQGTALDKLKRITRAFMGDPEFMALGIQEKARILNRKFQQISRWQAKRIVRTETTTISNYAIDQSATAMFPKEQLVKRWITSIDNNERPWHNAMNNEEEDYNTKFTVAYPKGVDYMHMAGEPTANPANRVNCRCIVVMVPKPDEFGL
jgi:hypothetical protein